MGAFSIPYILQIEETKKANDDQKQIKDYIGYFDEDISEQSGEKPNISDSESIEVTVPAANKTLSLEESENQLHNQLKEKTNKKRQNLSEKDFYNTLTIRQKEIYDNPLSEKGEWLPPFED